ncbi:hypothetical protein C8Q76DRAFT_705574 [Earliella scabrosa]|nr:hypothetical protein C8Q76DRAFT_705574 [Earliella scabrosa]
MRAFTLYAFCAAALLVPIHAAPLAVTTAINLPPLFPSLTLILDGPTEVPNVPVPTDKKSNAMMKNLARPPPPPHTPHLPRGPTFRQADYGVAPNATFDQIVPVQGVEASPTSPAPPTANSRRSSEDYWEANHLSADDYSYNNLAEVDAAPSAAPVAGSSPLSDVSDDASAATADGSKNSGTADGSSSGTGPGSGANPIGLGDPSSISKNHVPVKPDLSTGFRAFSDAVKTAGETRYNVSTVFHQLLAALFGNATDHTVPTTADVTKAHMDVEKANRKIGHSVHRRVLAPAQFLTNSAPSRRMMQFARDIVHFVSRHTLELNTDSVIPPDRKSLNMSDPAVAREAARRKNIGLLNVDSNQAPPARPPAIPKVDSKMPLNNTDTPVHTDAKNVTKAA